MKNSVIFLILFFIIGLGWLYSALIKQKQENAVAVPAV
jgi:hypothetical protein